jgi:hypothetical protein
LKKRAEVIKGGCEKFLLGRCEVSLGFGDEHFERINDGFCGTEVDLFFSTMGIRDLAEKKPGVLGLENDEFVKPWIGFRRWGHGRSVRVLKELYKGEDEIRAAFVSAASATQEGLELDGCNFHQPDPLFCLAGQSLTANLRPPMRVCHPRHSE